MILAALEQNSLLARAGNIFCETGNLQRKNNDLKTQFNSERRLVPFPKAQAAETTLRPSQFMT
jgi:hypothetical protein